MTTFIILICIALLVLGAVFFGIELILYILGGLALLTLAIMLIPITLDIKAEDELNLTLKILFLTFRLAPQKEKPIKLSDYKIRAFRKKRLKEQKKYFLKRPKKKKSQALAEDKKEDKIKKSLKENVDYVLDLLKYVILKAIKKFGKHLRINLYHLRIKVGGEEPDKTALTYGCICQSVSYITKLLDRHMNVRYPGRTENRVYVGADFSSPKTEFRLHIALTIKIWQIVSTGISALLGYLKMPKREPKVKINKENKPAKAGTEV